MSTPLPYEELLERAQRAVDNVPINDFWRSLVADLSSALTEAARELEAERRHEMERQEALARMQEEGRTWKDRAAAATSREEALREALNKALDWLTAHPNHRGLHEARLILAALAATAEPLPAPTVNCWKCNTANDPQYETCWSCDTPLVAPPSSSREDDARA